MQPDSGHEGRPARGQTRILAFAYMCSPGHGSEPGAGWNMARMLTTVGDTVVVTSSLNRPAIEAALPATPERARLQFAYVEMPRLAGRWSPSPFRRLNYFLWQAAALGRARELQREQAFDLAWHLTLAGVWFGSVACLTGLPYVYGPVGGGGVAPLRLLASLGARGAAYEIARTTFHALERALSPLTRLTLRRASVILVQDRETLGRLPARHRWKAEIFTNAVLDDRPLRAAVPGNRQRTAVFAGELRGFKGVCFAVRAISRRPEWRLAVLGAGPDERRLRRLARRLDVEERVEFLGWQPRSEVQRMLREEAAVFVFPSLHEGASLAVAEALACGLAVICVSEGGSPTLAGPAARLLPVRAGSARLVEALAGRLSATTAGERQIAYERAGRLSLEIRSAELERLLARRMPRREAATGTRP
jgi:glycosyltransferase involved in cell wall biosynthesis